MEQPAPATGLIQLVIWLDPVKRDVQVTGPIQDKIVCYAMLELARDAIKDWKPSAIQAPGPFRLPS